MKLINIIEYELKIPLNPSCQISMLANWLAIGNEE